MTTATATLAKESLIKIPVLRTATRAQQYGVHVHLFGINKEQQLISALILKRADNGLKGIVSGKRLPEETLVSTAYRETIEETEIFLTALFDTGRKLTIQCKNYDFHISVFTGLITHNTAVRLNHENIEYDYVSAILSPCHIEIPEQRKNQIFCINKAREMYQAIMN